MDLPSPMRSFYYFSFYLLASTIRRVNRKHADPNFSAIAFLSIVIAYFIFAIVEILSFIGMDLALNKLQYITIGGFVWLCNYNALNRKSDRIVYIFKKRYPASEHKGSVLLLVCFMLMCFIVPIALIAFQRSK